MKTVALRFAEQSHQYEVHVGSGILKNASTVSKILSRESYPSLFVLTDTSLSSLFADTIKLLPNVKAVISIPPGESAKGIDTVQHIWNHLISNKADRKSLLVTLGGGVISDIGGFAASTYMRGIDFATIPTTLLAMVDASIGGKTGINFGGIKNSVGSFLQPTAVIVDVDTLKTLPRHELISGFAEVIKHGLIADAEYFTAVTTKPPGEFTSNELAQIIYRSCEIKAEIVIADQTELGARKLLNFGHTIGHAIEALSHETTNPLSHGEAIAVGMMAEAHLALVKGLITQDTLTQMERAFNQAGLPTTSKGYSLQSIMERVALDKKNAGGTIKWTLITSIGEALYDVEADNRQIEEALQQCIL